MCNFVLIGVVSHVKTAAMADRAIPMADRNAARFAWIVAESHAEFGNARAREYGPDSLAREMLADQKARSAPRLGLSK